MKDRKPDIPTYPRYVPCPYCDGHGWSQIANVECGFCDNGQLLVTEPFIPGLK